MPTFQAKIARFQAKVAKFQAKITKIFFYHFRLSRERRQASDNPCAKFSFPKGSSNVVYAIKRGATKSDFDICLYALAEYFVSQAKVCCPSYCESGNAIYEILCSGRKKIGTWDGAAFGLYVNIQKLYTLVL